MSTEVAPPAIITVTFWHDREPEVESSLAPWLTEQVLYAAAETVWPEEEGEEAEDE